MKKPKRFPERDGSEDAPDEDGFGYAMLAGFSGDDDFGEINSGKPMHDGRYDEID